MMRLLLYGDIDLNLIDGSAVWLASLAEVLGGLDKVHVSVLQKTPLLRRTVIQEAALLPRVRFLDPWNWPVADDLPHTPPSPSPERRLPPACAASMIQALDRMAPYDLVLVRGTETLRALLDHPEVACRVWAYVTNPLQYRTEPGRLELLNLRSRFARIVCQTEEAKAVVLELTTYLSPEQVFILPPMIPSLPGLPLRTPDPTAPKLGYSGKFSAPYRILEMLDAFDEIRARLPKTEFHVVGDKFHNPEPAGTFASEVKRRFLGTPGVVWHGGLSRSDANTILARVDIAASWRTSDFDASVELSTKVLEYSALGLPVLMNPSPIQRRLFGPDYPAYVSTPQDFVERFLALSASPDLYRRASDHVRQVAVEHTFPNHRRRLIPVLQPSPPSTSSSDQRPTLLWAGHDFKFLNPIRERVEATGLYRSLTDRQRGHVVEDVAKSRRLLHQADLIFCEWCLGNAEWYSHHKMPHQRLVVRLHRQEIELPFLDRIRWDNVDRIIFIAEWLRQDFLSRFPRMADRAPLIYNGIDGEALGREKLPDASFNLGLMGYCPMLKAPHLAVELLGALKRLDRRYTLFIKGRTPQQLRWLWSRPREKDYYRELASAIERSRHANSIVFEPHTEDIQTWLSKIGFILSTSECEGSHQAIAEGMASGAIPVIRNWRGAAQLYPEQFVFSDLSQAVQAVRHWSAPERYGATSAACREFARRFDLPDIVTRYLTLLQELLVNEAPGDNRRSSPGTSSLAVAPKGDRLSVSPSLKRS